jgi:hypothetical protein
LAAVVDVWFVSVFGVVCVVVVVQPPSPAELEPPPVEGAGVWSPAAVELASPLELSAAGVVSGAGAGAAASAEVEVTAPLPTSSATAVPAKAPRAQMAISAPTTRAALRRP